MTKRQTHRSQQPASRPVVTAVAIGIVALIVLCAVALVLVNRSERPQSTSTREVTLRVAYSPEKGEVFAKLVEGFNATKAKTGRQRVLVEAVSLAPKEMISQAPDGSFQAVSPDSSIWLADMDRAWRDRTGGEADLVGETVRYMMSPVVIAMWSDVARSLG